jgi:hypothetical protein
MRRIKRRIEAFHDTCKSERKARDDALHTEEGNGSSRQRRQANDNHRDSQLLHGKCSCESAFFSISTKRAKIGCIRRFEERRRSCRKYKQDGRLRCVRAHLEIQTAQPTAKRTWSVFSLFGNSCELVFFYALRKVLIAESCSLRFAWTLWNRKGNSNALDENFVNDLKMWPCIVMCIAHFVLVRCCISLSYTSAQREERTACSVRTACAESENRTINFSWKASEDVRCTQSK